MAAISGSRMWPRASDAGCKPALRRANLALGWLQVWVTPSEGQRGTGQARWMAWCMVSRTRKMHTGSVVVLKGVIAKEWLSSICVDVKMLPNMTSVLYLLAGWAGRNRWPGLQRELLEWCHHEKLRRNSWYFCRLPCWNSLQHLEAAVNGWLDYSWGGSLAVQVIVRSGWTRLPSFKSHL